MQKEQIDKLADDSAARNYYDTDITHITPAYPAAGGTAYQNKTNYPGGDQSSIFHTSLGDRSFDALNLKLYQHDIHRRKFINETVQLPEMTHSKYDVKPSEIERQKKYSILGMESKNSSQKRSGNYNMNLQNMNIRMKTGLKTINADAKHGGKSNFLSNESTDYKK